MEGNTIRGNRVVLRPATEQDKHMVYTWLAESDVTSCMMGPPEFPDHPVPTWEEFDADFAPHYFDGSMPKSGRCYLIIAEEEPVGVICYNEIRPSTAASASLTSGSSIPKREEKWTDLDLWMRSEAECGRGYGPDALQALCAYLSQTYHIAECVISPSARNMRAIRAYQKAGFHPVEVTAEEKETQFGPQDYKDTIVMVRRETE